MRIAIIGAGVSGLVCAHLLQHTHELAVFEAQARLGGHVHTVPVAMNGREYAVDTGFIVYNERNYPLFSRLLASLEVSGRDTSMSFSVRSEATGLEYNGTTLNGVFAQRRNLLRPSFLGMLRDILRFHREAPALLDEEDEISVGDFVRARGYGAAFTEHYLVPMGAALWSCPTHAFRAFPMRFVVRFFHQHGMLQVAGRPQWKTVVGGSARYVERLVASFSGSVRMNTPVTAVRRTPRGVVVMSARGSEHFDHVIFACHGDQALALLADPTPAEHAVLQAVRYQTNEVVLHTDTKLLPRARRAWASWNYHLTGVPAAPATVSYNMNLLQGLVAPCTFLVTLNRSERIDPARVLRRMLYRHPVYTPQLFAAQARHAELLAAHSSSFCGAYWGYGFHEDGVRSAVSVCRALGVEFDDAQPSVRGASAAPPSRAGAEPLRIHDVPALPRSR